MWKIFAILGLALSFGVGMTFAQDGHSKKAGTGKNQQDLEQVFKAKDKDHDGKLSKEEFIGKVKDPERVKLLEGRFKTMDADGDGSSSRWHKPEPDRWWSTGRSRCPLAPRRQADHRPAAAGPERNREPRRYA